MSCIFGTFHRDKEVAEPKLWEHLGMETAYRGPDGTVIKATGPVLLGINLLKTTAESLQETLPYLCAKSGLAITADARLDNRKELLELLEINENDESPVPDSKIILSAYLRWGEDSFGRLLGDFSFVIWDSRKNKIVCVRDSLGVKPFYYALSDRLFSFSSEMISLVKHPDTSSRLNEGMIGEYLAAKFVSRKETLYSDILRLAGEKYLPDTIRRRHTKAEFSQLYYHAFNSKTFADALEKSKLHANGWVEKKPLLSGYRNNLDCFRKNESGPCPGTLPIWFAFAVSSWYEHNNYS